MLEDIVEAECCVPEQKVDSAQGIVVVTVWPAVERPSLVYVGSRGNVLYRSI